MNELIVDPAELEFLPAAVDLSQAAGADLDSTSTLETIQVRELTVTLVMEKIVQPRPSSHWGINE
jgi:hypothetical protein